MGWLWALAGLVCASWKAKITVENEKAVFQMSS